MIFLSNAPGSFPKVTSVRAGHCWNPWHHFQRTLRPRQAQFYTSSKAVSRWAWLWVLQETGQFLGHHIQFMGAGVPQKVALPHEVMLQEVLFHTLVEFADQPQEGLVEGLPILYMRVLLTGPEEHGLWREEVP